jgi:hypothetical protein
MTCQRELMCVLCVLQIYIFLQCTSTRTNARVFLQSGQEAPRYSVSLLIFVCLVHSVSSRSNLKHHRMFED